VKNIILMLLTFFLIGCQSGSSTSKVSNDHSLNPKVSILNLKEGNNNLSGSLKITEPDDFYSKVLFKDIAFNVSSCSITNFKSDEPVLSGKVVNFTANTSCSKLPSKVGISFTEIAKYMDTSIKSVTKTITQPVDLFSEKVFISPESVTLNEGGQITFNVHTFDENKTPVSESVKIDPPVDSDGKFMGKFDKYSLKTEGVLHTLPQLL